MEERIFAAVINPLYRVSRSTTLGAWMAFAVYRIDPSEWNTTRNNFWGRLNSGYRIMEAQSN
jgi:hypothetical protein